MTLVGEKLTLFILLIGSFESGFMQGMRDGSLYI